MSKTELHDRLRTLNNIIDRKILKGQSYKTEAAEHFRIRKALTA